jgi:hypothetical protein
MAGIGVRFSLHGEHRFGQALLDLLFVQGNRLEGRVEPKRRMDLSHKR